MLSLILEGVHQPFSLRVRVKSHRRSNLIAFPTWAHLPGEFLGNMWAVIDVAMLLDRSFHSIIVAPIGSEIHARRPDHPFAMGHLFKSGPVGVSFGNRLDCHVFNETSHSASVVPDKALSL